MLASVSKVVALSVIALSTVGCPRAAEPPLPAEQTAAHAVYAEYARGSNKLMSNGLNRRVFNTVEAQLGTQIVLANDGSIRLAPGTYRITGFSTVTMQTSFAPPRMLNNNNYPGYCMVIPKAAETAGGMEVMKQAIAVGSPQTALETVPSLFDAIYTTTTEAEIVVGHQSGEDLHGEVYLSVYEVEGIKSEYHVFARIAITKL